MLGHFGLGQDPKGCAELHASVFDASGRTPCGLFRHPSLVPFLGKPAVALQWDDVRRSKPTKAAGPSSRCKQMPIFFGKSEVPKELVVILVFRRTHGHAPLYYKKRFYDEEI
jgi:hypothetical protein